MTCADVQESTEDLQHHRSLASQSDNAWGVLFLSFWSLIGIPGGDGLSFLMIGIDVEGLLVGG